MKYPNTKLSKEPLFLGIDGGGTKCRVVLEDSGGRIIGRGLGGPANLVRSIDDSINAILLATYSALEQAKLDQTHLSRVHAVAGLAGANVADYKAKFSAWQHPFASMFVTTDMNVACFGAHPKSDGSVIILGTGFCAGTKIDGKVSEFGGYGMYLGDQASGASLGLQAIHHCFKVLDGVTAADDLSNEILSELKSDTAQQLLELMLSAKPAAFAQFAPAVLELAKQRQQTALAIVRNAARFVDEYIAFLNQKTPRRIAMIGGVAEPMVYWLSKESQSSLVNAATSPELGAAAMARQITLLETDQNNMPQLA